MSFEGVDVCLSGRAVFIHGWKIASHGEYIT